MSEVNRMRKHAVWLVILLSCSVAWAQDDKPPMDLPVYPGGSSTMEINVTSEELLQMMQAMIPLAGDKLGKLGEVINPESISDILKDVRRIEYLQVDIPQPGVKEDQIAAFYAKKLPAGRWSRVLWLTDSRSGAAALYSQPNTEQLYGFRVTSVKAEKKTIKRADILKIEGRIDYAKALKLAAAVGAMLHQPAKVDSGQ